MELADIILPSGLPDRDCMLVYHDYCLDHDRNEEASAILFLHSFWHWPWLPSEDRERWGYSWCNGSKGGFIINRYSSPDKIPDSLIWRQWWMATLPGISIPRNVQEESIEAALLKYIAAFCSTPATVITEAVLHNQKHWPSWAPIIKDLSNDLRQTELPA